MTRVYMAARYGRRREIAGYAEELRAIGFNVVATWLDGEHEAIDATAGPEDQQKWAEQDLLEIRGADLVICFTEPPGAPGAGRGGRHVEYGIALALEIPIAIVGPSENVFHNLDEIGHYSDWSDFLAHLGLGVGA